MISISSQFNKPDNAEKDKPRRGRRPNAIKNYAQLINNSDGEDDEIEQSRNESKRGRKTKGDANH